MGADRDRVGYTRQEEGEAKKIKNKKEGDGRSDGGMVPKGAERKRAVH